MSTPEIHKHIPTPFEAATSYLFKFSIGRKEFHPEIFTHAVKTVAQEAAQKKYQPFTIFSAVVAGTSIGMGIDPKTGEQLQDKDVFAAEFGKRFNHEAFVNNQQDFQNALKQSTQKPNNE